uniref:Uncharacterized protein n=1 Tax=Kocuria rosea subsp. polaris TaxID=136273 RepID=A0A0A6VRM0_KOCRO|nr:hypothetical protein GY22_12830 [Kocuria polaris]
MRSAAGPAVVVAKEAPFAGEEGGGGWAEGLGSSRVLRMRVDTALRGRCGVRVRRRSGGDRVVTLS